MIRLFFIFSVMVVLTKLVLLGIFSFSSFSLGGGNDADYYHCYAVGDCSYAVNVWPVFLRWLESLGLYSREDLTLLLSFLALLVIPFFVGKLTKLPYSSIKNRIFWLSFFFMSIYPSLNFFTLDIYRDVAMVFLFVLGLGFFKYLSGNHRKLKKLIVFILALAWAYLLFLFRPYLGAGYVVSLFFAGLYSFRRFPFFVSVLLFLFVLNMLSLLGYLDPILAYREGFVSKIGTGSTLGITFSSNLTFIPSFMKSFLYQIIGAYFVNLGSVFVFFTESVPFLLAVVYLIRNRKYADKFVDYLILFFVAYAAVWLIGNDNLGTAVRLRMYNYIAIGVAFCVVYQNKRIVMNGIVKEKSL